ncbi:MAG: hypothetical protein WD431_02125 [Cyclobacteriaceae bacterium]
MKSASSKKPYFLHLVVILIFFLNFQGHAQEQEDDFKPQEDDFKPNGKIWGYVFGDVIFKVGGDTLDFGRSEFAETEKNTIGGVLRRIYFGYDYNLSTKWTTRLLFESNASTTTPGGNFGLVVKLGYLEYKGVFEAIPNSKIRVGLIPTPVFAFPEKAWGYRSVEKEALDLRGFGSSTDQGISFEGNFSKDGNSGFTIMIGNGVGNKPQTRKYLEYYISLYKMFFDKKLNLELMIDYSKRDKDLNRTILRGFASYSVPNFRAGMEISPNLVNEKASFGQETINIETQPLLLSTFISPQVYKNTWLFLRYDYFNPDRDYNENITYGNQSQNYDEHLFIAGVQIEIHNKLDHKINIMPNIHINAYDKKKNGVVDRDPDVVLRTTVYYNF